MKQQINIAVVAYGRIAKTHILAAYMANLKFCLPFELKVSHIVTSRPESIRFSNIKICSSLQKALKDSEEIDILDICNINEAHYDDIKLALKYNKAIYCEKPLTDCFDKSYEVSKLVKMANVINGVPLIFRYLPCIHMLKKELFQQKLGKIISFDSKYYHCGYLDETKRNTWRTRKSSGGGASIDLGIHMVDLIRYILGEPKQVENHVITHFDNDETDEIYQSTMKFANGCIGAITASRIYAQQKQSIFIEVFCEKGSYLCNLDNPYVLNCNEFHGSTWIMKANPLDDYMKYMVKESDATSFHLDAHMCCLVDFARKVYGVDNGNYYADFEQAYLSQRLLHIQ